jgi:hypothetical protein
MNGMTLDAPAISDRAFRLLVLCLRSILIDRLPELDRAQDFPTDHSSTHRKSVALFLSECRSVSLPQLLLFRSYEFASSRFGFQSDAAFVNYANTAPKRILLI